MKNLFFAFYLLSFNLFASHSVISCKSLKLENEQYFATLVSNTSDFKDAEIKIVQRSDNQMIQNTYESYFSQFPSMFVFGDDENFELKIDLGSDYYPQNNKKYQATLELFGQTKLLDVFCFFKH